GPRRRPGDRGRAGVGRLHAAGADPRRRPHDRDRRRHCGRDDTDPPAPAADLVPRRLPVSHVHHTLGAITIAVNALAALLGALGSRTRPTKLFGVALRTGQGLVILEAVTGAALLLDGKDLPRLHLIYGLVPIAVSFVAEQLRLASADIVLQQRG